MEEVTCSKVSLAKAITIPPNTQSRAVMRQIAVGCGLIQNHPKTVLRDLTLIANDIMKLKYNTPFWVHISNLKYIAVRMLRHTTVRLVITSAREILQLDQHTDGGKAGPSSGKKVEDTTTHWKANSKAEASTMTNTQK